MTDPSLDDDLLALLQPVVARVRGDVTALKEPGVGIMRTDDALTRSRLLRHIHGHGVRGAYLIKPGENVVRCAVLDLDDHGKVWPWEQVAAVAARLMRAAGAVGLRANPWSSSSGHGIHLWFLWDEPQDARSVRVTLEGVLRSCMLAPGAGGLDKGEVEIFPKQDSVAEGSYGNQVWLPLGGVGSALEPDLVDGTLRPVPRGWLAGVYSVGGWDWAMSEPVAVLPGLPVEAKAPREVVILDADDADKVDELRAMLSCVTDYSYDNWLKVGFALHEGTAGRDEGLNLWDEWSSRGAEYQPGACTHKWSSMGRGGSGERGTVGLGTLRHMALAGGWLPVVEFEDISVPSVDVGAGTDDGVQQDPLVQDQPRFERDKEGRILPTTSNILLALARPDMTGYHLGVDTFKEALMFAKRPGEWELFSDVHYTRIKNALENHGKGFRPIARVEVKECVADIADRNRFDSAQLWLNGLKWDGVKRIDNFLYDYWGAADTEYTRAVSLYIWTALAGRVLDPGCQADMMPILVGDEGPGKTSVIRALVPSDDYFCEVAFDEKDDDIARKLRGVLAVEVAELRGLGTRDEESIYAFVTRRYEKWVPKFKEFAASFPRRSILFGTTNDGEFLSKEGRRWLPFNVGARAGRAEDAIRVDAVERDRAQLWAEGAARWRASGQAWQEVKRLGPAARAEFIHVHPWEEQIAAWLADYVDVVAEKDDKGDVFIPSYKIIGQGLGITGRMSGADGRQIAKVMPRLGYVRAVRNGGLIRGWARRVPQKGD